ncbi:MAG: DUF4832 domain-containing protein, partial [Treponema sp.]|nr:DUF4832 domain-containing protein [Treponema sp.]
LSPAVKDGYTFAGWSDGNGIISSIPKGSTGNITLTATWSVTGYTVSYSVPEGALNPNAGITSYTIESDTIYLEPAVRKGNWKFTGWSDGSTTVTSIPSGSTENKVLTATWEEFDYGNPATDEIITTADVGFYRTINEQFGPTGCCDKNGNSFSGSGLMTSEYVSVLKKPLEPELFYERNYGKLIEDGDKDSHQYSNLVHLIVDLSQFSKRGQALKPLYLANKAELKAKKNLDDKHEFVALNSSIVEQYNAAVNSDSTSDVDQLSLNGLSAILEEFRSKNKTAVIRFHYDPCNAGFEYYWFKDEANNTLSSEYFDYEPYDFTTTIGSAEKQGHIAQVCAYLAPYQDVIAAIECGFVGPWGEMHGTTYGDGFMSKEDFNTYAQGTLTGSYNLDPVLKNVTINEQTVLGLEKAHSILVMRKYLEEMQKNNLNCPLLVRYPFTLYSYMKIFESENITNISEDIPSINEAAFDESDLSWRLGMYNDGYLGSYSDYGTFKIKKPGSTDLEKSRRTDEVEFLEHFLRHTAYGGELLAHESTSKPAYWEMTDVSPQKYDACEEMSVVHLSYLNISHSPAAFTALDTVQQMYNGQTKFRYILSHMGYRYVIQNLSQNALTVCGSKLNISLKIKNEGFTEMPFHRVKGFKLYILPKGSTPKGNETAVNVPGELKGDYSSADVKEIEHLISTNVSLSSYSTGDYDVYLKVCDISSDSRIDGKYYVRFANEETWNAALNANKLGTVTIE